jgi:hypothetical protein
VAIQQNGKIVAAGLPDGRFVWAHSARDWTCHAQQRREKTHEAGIAKYDSG